MAIAIPGTRTICFWWYTIYGQKAKNTAKMPYIVAHSKIHQQIVRVPCHSYENFTILFLSWTLKTLLFTLKSLSLTQPVSCPHLLETKPNQIINHYRSLVVEPLLFGQEILQ